jgi:hypothetical protein
MGDAVSTQDACFLQGGAIHRGMGYALSVCLGLLLLPVTRWSIWLHVFGVPFERALRIHRYVTESLDKHDVLSQ